MSKQLPDTPWHIGMPKMKESDHRRLNKWCIHYKESICKEPKSGCYMLKCGGSSHCRFYAENKKESEKIKRDTRTQMEIDADNRRKYVQSLEPKMQELVYSLDDRRYLSVRSLTKCYICGEKLLELGNHRKQCSLCHMEYIDQSSWLTDTSSMDGRFVYVMGREKTAKASAFRKEDPCRSCNRNGKCRDGNLPLSCLKKQHPNTKQFEANKFTGVSNIPLSRIVIRNMSQPRQSKLDRAIESIQQNGGVTKPIVVELSNNKYVLIDGYSRYLAARHCGLSRIPARLKLESEKKK